MNKFSTKEAISFGWHKMRQNFWFFVKIFAFFILVAAVSGFLSDVFKGVPLIASLIGFTSWALFFIFSIGLIKISLDLAFGNTAEFNDLFSEHRLFLKFLIAKILYGIIVTAGLFLLIVPGIIWSIKFRFFPYFVVDQKMGPIKSLKESSRVTDGAKWDLFLFIVLLGLINLAGALALVVGLLFTIPTTIIALAFVYHKLSVFGAELSVKGEILPVKRFKLF
jgi:uncharacterized membrane protein